MIQWIKGSSYSQIATISPNYITLNNYAANHFADVKWCLVGIDEEEMKIAIKPIPKSVIEKQIYPMESLHKISLGSGYARISNKTIMQTIATICPQPLASNAKYLCSYDDKEDMLIINLNTKED